MNDFMRTLHHLSTTRAKARRLFPQTTLKAVQAAIGEGESRHRAQLRVIIEPALRLSELAARTTARGRAHALFSRYRIWDTEENCGVLLYINLADRKVEIVTDRAVGRAVPRTDWESACQIMTHGFAANRFHDSLLASVAQVNALLTTHFPTAGSGGRANELSDRPVIL